MTEPVAVDYAPQAADALLDLAVTDPRADPDVFEAWVRAQLGEWLSAVDAATGSDAIAVRDARLWLVFVTGDLSGLAITVFVAGRRWVRTAPEPPNDDSMPEAEHWNFVQEWPLRLDPVEGWRLGVGTTRSLEEFNGYRFVSSRETAQEYEARTGIASLPTRPPAARRFLVEASMVDHAAYYGGSASIIVERATPPSRLEAEALMQEPMQAEMRRTKGEAEYQPTITALASYELLD